MVRSPVGGSSPTRLVALAVATLALLLLAAQTPAHAADHQAKGPAPCANGADDDADGDADFRDAGCVVSRGLSEANSRQRTTLTFATARVANCRVEVRVRIASPLAPRPTDPRAPTFPLEDLYARVARSSTVRQVAAIFPTASANTSRTSRTDRLAAGRHTLTARYPGDAWRQPSPTVTRRLTVPAGCRAARATTPPRLRGQVSLRGNLFTPRTATIYEGGAVTWTNNDPVVHDVSASAFRSPFLQPRRTFRQRFSRAGVFSYVCTLHPGMAGAVRVTVR